MVGALAAGAVVKVHVVVAVPVQQHLRTITYSQAADVQGLKAILTMTACLSALAAR